ncbi:hypothetical protein WG907_15925 [Sphingobium sp. AN558]|uniref:hypothetical protein n=1 Tax=Sphingobium sp. AN558 TaxID=3133442 RepID=UPI0030C386AB
MSPAKLMEKVIGRTVTIMRINPATGAEPREQTRVLSVNGGAVLSLTSKTDHATVADVTLTYIATGFTEARTMSAACPPPATGWTRSAG